VITKEQNTLLSAT